MSTSELKALVSQALKLTPAERAARVFEVLDSLPPGYAETGDVVMRSSLAESIWSDLAARLFLVVMSLIRGCATRSVDSTG